MGVNNVVFPIKDNYLHTYFVTTVPSIIPLPSVGMPVERHLPSTNNDDVGVRLATAAAWGNNDNNNNNNNAPNTVTPLPLDPVVSYKNCGVTMASAYVT